MACDRVTDTLMNGYTHWQKDRNTFVVLDLLSRLKTFKLKLKEQDSSAEEK